MAKKSGSSRRWLQEHATDHYVKQAKQDGYRSRSVYKLIELQERDKLFRPAMTVVDLGSTPGGWSQLAASLVGKKGRVIAVDLLEMEPIPDVEFIQGDFTEQSILDDLMNKLQDAKVDWVLSDMAPNMSGIDSVDQPRSMGLAEIALEFALQVLSEHGGFLVKVFQGEGFDSFLLSVRKNFKKVIIRKPKASRGRSREVYILAKK